MRAEQTIVSTCLPTIASEFEANQAEYTWVSVTYMLTQTAFQPLYGKLSDLIGRTVRLSPRRPWCEYVLMRGPVGSLRQYLHFCRRLGALWERAGTLAVTFLGVI